MSEQFYRHASEAASRIVGSEAVIVRARQGEMTVLSESASVLWASMDGARTAEDLAKILARAYGLDALPEIRGFLDELVEKGLAELRDRASRVDGDLPAPQPAGIYDSPAILATEPLEVLAATCASGWESLGPCTPLEYLSCPDPWDP